jgi:hypothetical protein
VGADPWERYQDQSMLYGKWWGEKLWTVCQMSRSSTRKKNIQGEMKNKNHGLFNTKEEGI